jgi:hypothetical protein
LLRRVKISPFCSIEEGPIMSSEDPFHLKTQSAVFPVAELKETMISGFLSPSRSTNSILG